MDSFADVVLFAFRDSAQAADLAAAASRQRGVRCVAVVGRVSDREIRIISQVDTKLVDARWTASIRPVLDTLSRLLGERVGRSAATEPVTLPDSAAGFRVFSRLVERGEPVLLVAMCDGSQPPVRQFVIPLTAGLFRVPAGCPMGLQTNASAN